MKFRRIATAFVAIGLALGMASANAAPLTVDLKYINQPFGSVQGDVDTTKKTNVRAGEFQFEVTRVDDGAPFSVFDRILAFCVEAEVRLTTGTSVTYSIHDALELYTSATVASVSQLYSGFYSSAKDAIGSAAFQIALWEIIYEADGTAFDLTAGLFSVRPGSDDWEAAVALATSWLGNLDGKNADRRFLVLKSADSQDLIFIPVPEPGTLLLIGSGLLLGGALRRRRVDTSA